MLDATRTVCSSATKLDLAIEKWFDFPFSALSHHGFECCQIAREWIVAMDLAQLNAANLLTAPRWVRQRYAWGPSQWPLHWCDAVKSKTLDCGALASISQEIFAARNVASSPVQMIQEFNSEAAEQWQSRWSEAESSEHWLSQNLIYHEGCAVRIGQENEIKIWDASAGWWINPYQPKGYGSLLAVRIFAGQTSAVLKWGAHNLNFNYWQKIEQS